VMFRGHDNAL